MDLVSAHSYARGNGDGTFRLTPALGGGGHSSVSSDFDGDGRHDIALASGLGRILVYKGTGGPLLPRTHTIVARFEDLAGNRAPDSTPLSLTVDPAAPGAAAVAAAEARKRYRPRSASELLG